MTTTGLFKFILFAAWAGQAASAQPPRETYSAAITEDQLESFAAAVVELSAIERRYAPRLEQAAGAERGQLHERASRRMISAIQQSGISVGTFNRIVAEAEHDQEMSKLVTQMVRQEVARSLH